MPEPRIPGSVDEEITLPCDRTVAVDTFDMGMREFVCTCGDTHAVVMDVHPLGRWIPESIVGILTDVIEPSDEYDQFGTIHTMGIVLEEFPEAVSVADVSENPSVGWALLWVTEFDARRLHEIIVELLVELMDHAIGHADDPDIHSSFEEQLASFDVEAFVDAYRDAREFDGPADRAV